MLLPDEPEVVAEGFNPEFLEDRTNRGGGTIYGPDGRRQLRLWGLTLGMTLYGLSHSTESIPLTAFPLASAETFSHISRKTAPSPSFDACP